MAIASQDVFERLAQGDPDDPSYASRFVDVLLEAAAQAGASDLHLRPTDDGLEIGWRIDGVLHPLGRFPRSTRTSVVTRLKVLADLLTYQADVPQEGRIRAARADGEMRVSTFPTVYGEKAVVRLFGAQRDRFARIADLGLPGDVETALAGRLSETAGAIVIAGPAGSGKTTTAYAALRDIVAAPVAARSVVSLEDPVETVVAGVSQSQVNEAAGFDLATGLRSLMRQDPEVILVGEIRDRRAAEIALQAALTGQLVITTFHAASSAGAISRLSDMGIEPYVLRSGILAIVAQRLVRRLCSCAQPGDDEQTRLGLPVSSWRLPVGCDACRGTGYQGRIVLAEMLALDDPALAREILARSDAAVLYERAIESGMVPLRGRGAQAVESGHTSPAEIRRVLGFSTFPGL